jgi:predicted nucleic acid-binding protein
VNDLGPGETEVLALALESSSPVVVLDDGLARRAAKVLNVPLTGTLGLLLDAKTRGLVPAVLPLLDRLQELRFRVSTQTRESVLRSAGEGSGWVGR